MSILAETCNEMCNGRPPYECREHAVCSLCGAHPSVMWMGNRDRVYLCRFCIYNYILKLVIDDAAAQHLHNLRFAWATYKDTTIHQAIDKDIVKFERGLRAHATLMAPHHDKMVSQLIDRREGY